MNLLSTSASCLSVIFFLLSANYGNSQNTIYYTSDLSQEEVFDVIKEKDKYEKQAKSLLGKAEKLQRENYSLKNRREKDSRKIQKLGRENYKLRGELRANLAKWEKERNSYREELNILRAQKRKDFERIKALERTIELLNENITELE
ncbi:MAG: hypothetical protein DWQ02_28420, partial [Bacteroidetes bacterium]